MIIDTKLFESTSRGSARKILCRCDVCGEDKLIAKQKLVKRGDEFARCQKCFYARNPVGGKEYVPVTCRDCGNTHQKRQDSIPQWGGRCQRCAGIEIAKRPEIKAVHRENGRRNPPPRENVKNIRRGADHHSWRGGITPEHMKIRLSTPMRNWRRAVMERDDFTCTFCGQRGGDLHADHIQPFAVFPELRFDLSNGRTLCVSCHRAYGAKVCKGVVTNPAVFPEQRKVG